MMEIGDGYYNYGYQLNIRIWAHVVSYNESHTFSTFYFVFFFGTAGLQQVYICFTTNRSDEDECDD